MAKKRKVRKGRKGFNVRKLTEEAGKLVQEHQNASYAFLRDKLKVGVGTVVKVLKRLEVKGLVRRGANRRWAVLVNADGSKKPDAGGVPQRRRIKKRRVRRERAAAAPAVPKQHVPTNGQAIGTDQKVALLENIASVAGDEKAAVLRAVIEDIKSLDAHQKMVEALK